MEEAVRKIEGVVQMLIIGNREGFGICNMVAAEKKLIEALMIIKAHQNGE